MQAINRKLLRDLWSLKGQVASIAIVVACGIAAFVAMASARTSLQSSKEAYYERYRFGDVFARLVRAPESTSRRISEIDGVTTVYTRIVKEIIIPMPGQPEPPSARLVSLPDRGEPALNAVHIREGRFPRDRSLDEVIVAEAFAKAHGLRPGARLPAIINGSKRELIVVGVGLSPEYVFSLMPTDISADDSQFGIIWVRRRALATAFQMEGAFNDVTLKLAPGTAPKAVLEALDHVLAPYGTLGAVARERQISNFILEGELTQLEQISSVAPLIFLAVAAFLLNIVLSQLVSMQRQQIAALRAVGYGKLRIVSHFLQLALTIVFLGSVVGVLAGAYFGDLLTGVYARFFTFPVLLFNVEISTALVAIGVSAAAGIIGAFASVSRVARLPPAEALRPPSPPSYRRSIINWSRVSRWLPPTTTMVLRELTRRPLRLFLSSLGIGAAIGIVIVGRFSSDAFESLITDSLERERPADISVTFFEPVGLNAVSELEAIRGVLDAEGHRVVGVRFWSQHRRRDGALYALPTRPRLRRIVDSRGNFVDPPARGILISRKLGELLDLGVGDPIRLEFTDGEKRQVSIPIARLVDDTFGLQGYLSSEMLAELLGESTRFSNMELAVDSLYVDAVLARLAASASVGSITRPQRVIQAVRDRSGTSLRIMTLVLSLFGVAIAVGVVYNNARVALAHRRRDLASLRVLGFTRGEISGVLLGELTAQMVLALPIGIVLGSWWVDAMMSVNDPETFRLPVTVSWSTYAFAISVALVAGLTSALLVRRKLDNLDLIAVLKTRE